MTRKELQERQGWTLNQKIDHSLGTIDQFISRTNGKAYVAFSCGKDSTVLLHLCRLIKKDIPAVFVKTGCEYPDIIKFVRMINDTWGGVITLHPKMRVKDVWSNYGFPLVSKEVAHTISTIRHKPDGITAKKALDDSNKFRIAKRWRYLIDAPYEISAKCCDILKKQPSHEYQKRTGNYPIIGTMASESHLRTVTYIRRGQCNVFGEMANSLPLSIWTDNDIWDYIRSNNIPYAEIYDKGLDRTGCVACGFRAGDASDYRMRTLYDIHNKYYNAIMQFENNGVPYREALRDMFKAYSRYLPDEVPWWMKNRF